MKKIISCIALAFILFACKKEENMIGSNADTNLGSIEKNAAATNPVVTTTYFAPDITYTTATAGGTVASGSNVSERGVCWNTSPNPTTSNSKVSNGSGAGAYTCSITGLTAGTTYYVRAYTIAKNKSTAYGNQLTFTTLITPVYGTVTDIDGNNYITIKIGTQTWMMENLKTTRYSDGTPIPNVTDDAAWGALTTGAYCNYDNNESNVATYGRLYNFYAAADVRNLAPAGWRVPTQADWTILETYLGGTVTNGYTPVIGRKLKETGTAHWLAPNPADNVSGFTVLPAGERLWDGRFGALLNGIPTGTLGLLGMFWSSSLASYSGMPYGRYLNWEVEYVHWGLATNEPGNGGRRGLSVRCVKN
jgi:uncharacterized protein (TIGR02145 family)